MNIKKTLAFSLLSLFTSGEKALAIEGDLLEESAAKGDKWFVAQLLATLWALFSASFRQSLGKNIGLSSVGLVATILICYPFCVFNIVSPDNPWGYLLLPLVALVVGALLVKIAPRLGMNAAIATSLSLLLLFLFGLASTNGDQLFSNLQQGGLLTTLQLLGMMLLQSLFALVIFIAPISLGGYLVYRPS